jgi:hypothetical protein
MPSKRNSGGTPGKQAPIPHAIRLSGNSVSEQENTALETSDQKKEHKVEQNGTVGERTERCHVPILREDFSEQVGNIHDNETMLLEIQAKLKAGDPNTAIRMLEILDHHVQESADPKNRVLIPHIQNLLATAQNQSHKLTQRLLHVFLCHATADKPQVRELYLRMKEDGFSPWLDEEELLPGEEWQAKIPAAVKASDVVVVCLSSRSVTKEGYVQREIKIAVDIAEEKVPGAIFVIPARLEDGFKVPSILSRWQWVDLFKKSGYSRLKLALRARADALGLSTS